MGTIDFKNINISLNIVLFNLDFLCIVLLVHLDWLSVAIMLSFYVFFPLSFPVLDHVEAGRSGSEENIDILQSADNRPIISGDDLKVEQVVEGLELPTSMAFLEPNDFLVLEKQSGTVKRVLDGTTLEQPVLDVSVANENERGMLGVAVEKEIDGKSKMNSHTYVFVVFTESDEDGSDDCSTL